MQVQKQEIRKNILKAATKEFVANGYEKASVRTITAKAKTSKSNVYNYFSDKDALFAAVVEPAVAAMNDAISQLREVAISGASTMPAQREAMARLMDAVYSHEGAFRLLFFQSAGSSLAAYRETATDALAGVLYSWIASAYPDAAPSEFFIRTTASFYINTITQMLSQGMSHEQAALHLYEFLKFLYGGWNEVLA